MLFANSKFPESSPLWRCETVHALDIFEESLGRSILWEDLLALIEFLDGCLPITESVGVEPVFEDLIELLLFPSIGILPQ